MGGAQGRGPENIPKSKTNSAANIKVWRKINTENLKSPHRWKHKQKLLKVFLVGSIALRAERITSKEQDGSETQPTLWSEISRNFEVEFESQWPVCQCQWCQFWLLQGWRLTCVDTCFFTYLNWNWISQIESWLSILLKTWLPILLN